MTTEQSERERILQQMAEATRAEEPGTLKVGEDIGSPDDPFYAQVASIKSAGYAVIYDIRTGEVSKANWNMLPDLLAEKHRDGSPVWQTTPPPSYPPNRGIYRCPLHKDHRMREFYNTLGFPYCNKATLRSEYDAEEHFRRTHKREYRIDAERRLSDERQEDREFQRGILERMAGIAPAEALLPEEGEVTEVEPQIKLYTKLCDICGKTFEARTAGILDNQLRLHHRVHRGGNNGDPSEIASTD